MNPDYETTGNTHQPEARDFHAQILVSENEEFSGTHGVSQNNRASGFTPAFRDTRNNTVYLSRHADGNIAPIHVLDGFPDDVVTTRTATGCVTAISIPVESGFVLDGRFYTREQAADQARRN